MVKFNASLQSNVKETKN